MGVAIKSPLLTDRTLIAVRSVSGGAMLATKIKGKKELRGAIHLDAEGVELLREYLSEPIESEEAQP